MNLIEQVWAEIHKRGFKSKALRTLEEVMYRLRVIIQNLQDVDLKSIVNNDEFDVPIFCWFRTLTKPILHRYLKELGQ